MKGKGPPRCTETHSQAQSSEALVKVVKNGIRNRTGSLQTRLQRFLLSYRSTPHSTTGQSPAELLFGRPLRTRLDLCKPNLRQTVELKQHNWKSAYDQGTVDRHFTAGDPVYVCLIPGPGAPWEPATVISADGQTCTVTLADGRSFTRHRDHVRHRVCGPPVSRPPPVPVTPARPAPPLIGFEPYTAPALAVPAVRPAAAPEARYAPAPEVSSASAVPVARPASMLTPPQQSPRGRRSSASAAPVTQSPVPVLTQPRRSQRDRRPPVRLGID